MTMKFYQVRVNDTEYRIVEARHPGNAEYKADHDEGIVGCGMMPFFATDEEIAELPIDQQKQRGGDVTLPGWEVR